MRIMYNYPQNAIFLYYNLKLHKMIEIHSKYDNMHTKRIFNALNCVNNHVNSCTNCMLSTRLPFYRILAVNVIYGVSSQYLFFIKFFNHKLNR